MFRSKNTKKGRRGPKAPQRGRQMIPHPPPIHDYSIVHDRRLRFISNAAYQGAITYQNLLDLLVMATSATTGADLFESVKVKAVECWATPILGQVATVGVVYDGTTAGAVGDRRNHTDSSMGIEPAHLVARPAPRSLVAMFQLSSAAVAFELDVPSGAVIDVLLSFKQGMVGLATATQNALVSATTGAVYARGLDGLASATTKLAPPPNITSI